MWLSAVLGAISSWRAASFAVCPAAISRSTSISRGVRPDRALGRFAAGGLAGAGQNRLDGVGAELSFLDRAAQLGGRGRRRSRPAGAAALPARSGRLRQRQGCGRQAKGRDRGRSGDSRCRRGARDGAARAPRRLCPLRPVTPARARHGRDEAAPRRFRVSVRALALIQVETGTASSPISCV